jgi:phosphoribosylpyrophosphate synthetase
VIDRLAFAACYAYSPHGIGATSSQSRDLCRRIKRADSEAVALATARVSQYVADGRFTAFFGSDVTLVPVPGRAPLAPGAISRTQRFCDELVRRGLARETVPLIARIRPVAKSAYAAPAERPDAVEHHDSMDMQRTLVTPHRILLVDDVVTRGATLLGAASLLLEAVEHSEVRAFAFIRTISPGEVDDVRDPCEGWIERLPSGGTVRRP